MSNEKIIGIIVIGTACIGIGCYLTLKSYGTGFLEPFKSLFKNKEED